MLCVVSCLCLFSPYFQRLYVYTTFNSSNTNIFSPSFIVFISPLLPCLASPLLPSSLRLIYYLPWLPVSSLGDLLLHQCRISAHSAYSPTRRTSHRTASFIYGYTYRCLLSHTSTHSPRRPRSGRKGKQEGEVKWKGIVYLQPHIL